MEIRIRHASDTEARVLADIPFRADVINNIIPTLGSWGVITGGNGPFEESAMVGQFVDDGTHAYFEVVIGDED